MRGKALGEDIRIPGKMVMDSVPSADGVWKARPHDPGLGLCVGMDKAYHQCGRINSQVPCKALVSHTKLAISLEGI